MFDLVIRSDRVVTPSGVGACDVAIEGEKIDRGREIGDQQRRRLRHVQDGQPGPLPLGKMGRVLNRSERLGGQVGGGKDVFETLHRGTSWNSRPVLRYEHGACQSRFCAARPPRRS